MSFSIAVREAVWERSSGLCERKLLTGQRCLAPGAEFHHIVLKSHHGRKMRVLIDSKENCMLTCLNCHRERHDGVWNEDADDLVPGLDVRRSVERRR